MIAAWCSAVMPFCSERMEEINMRIHHKTYKTTPKYSNTFKHMHGLRKIADAKQR